MKLNPTQQLDYENEISSLFKHYPIELIQASLLPLLPNNAVFNIESLNIKQLFYLELNTIMQRCLFAYHHNNSYPEPIEEEKINLKNIQAIVKMLKEVIPISYIFCNTPSQEHCNLTIVLDQYLYQPLEQAESLVKFTLHNHLNISCKLFTYGTMTDLIRNGHFYYGNFCVKENCIYQRNDRFNLPVSNTDLLATSKTQAIANFKQHSHKANNFFMGAQHFLIEKEYEMAAFMLQQACEFTFNSVLVAFMDKPIRSHDLLTLRKQASHYLPKIIGSLHDKPKKEVQLLSQIQGAYIKARYDEHYQITTEQLMVLITATQQFTQRVQFAFEELIN